MTIGEMALLTVVFLTGIFFGCAIWESACCRSHLRAYERGVRIGIATVKEEFDEQETGTD